MIASFNLKLERLNVKIVFLHGELKEMIYIYESEGFITQGKEVHACLLKKSLYGIKGLILL